MRKFALQMILRLRVQADYDIIILSQAHGRALTAQIRYLRRNSCMLNPIAMAA